MQGREVGRRRHARLAAVAVVAATLVPAFGQPSYASTSSSYFSVLSQERASHGVAALHVSADLVRVAQSWAEEMARTGVLRHNPHLESQVPNWWSVGENVGVGPDLPDIEQAFWNSPDHRANILDTDYTDVGIGAAYSNDRIWIAVVFRQPWHHVTRHVVPPAQPQPTPSASTPVRSPQPLRQPRSFVRCMWWGHLWALR